MTQALDDIDPVQDTRPGNHSHRCGVVVAVASVIKAKGSRSTSGDTPQGSRDSQRNPHPCSKQLDSQSPKGGSDPSVH